MTFPKYLVIFGMLLAGWSMAGAADSTPGDASASSSTSDDALTGTHTTPTHHRRHHSDQDESETKKKSTSTGKTGTDAEKKEETRKKSASGEEHNSETKSSSAGKAGEETTRKKSTSASEHGSGQEKSDEAVPTAHHRRRQHTESTETTGSGSETARKKSGEPAKAKDSEKAVSKTAPASPAAKTAETPASSASTEKEEEGHERHHGTSTEAASTEAKPGEVSTEAGNTHAAAKTEKTESTSRSAGHSTSSSSTASTHHRHHHSEPPPIVVTPSAVPLPEQVAPGAPAPTALGGTTAPASLAPTVETGLPVARPGAGTTATLPIDLGHRAPSAAPFHFTDYPPLAHRSTRTYPWKTSIYTTVFWIGEGGSSISSTTNIQSAWDMNWIHHNGGTDDPDEMSRMSGYSSLTHASTLNPFYIALPFNDLAYPEKAERWLPRGWYKPTRHGEKPVSACKGRWIEIKTRSGRVCYAQWEDVGPLVSDHPEYVFGPERPDTLTRAGLDVSPAVAKYLGFDSNAMTSWRFVDDADVEPGMWLRYDEQAILFQALKEQMHPHRTPRIQDLSEPSPDGSGQDDNEKRSGAAR